MYLRCCNYDSSVGIILIQKLANGNVFVGCTRRRVNDQKIEFSPLNVFQELLNYSCIILLV
jgi:hypothetical protein